MEDYDGKTDPDAVVLDGLYVWAQIHKIPDMYRRETDVDQLARRIGKVREVLMQPTLFYEGDYVRVCVKIPTDKPLARFIPLTVVGEGTRMLVVKYEKIPYFCKLCGLMGHGFEECGNGVWKEEDKKRGGWMIAQRREMQFSSNSGGRFPSHGGRGGRGANSDRGSPARGRGHAADPNTYERTQDKGIFGPS
ncbi:Organic cation transporter protein [Hordeum vulgare]|nr:Organic cation transporter protein [Hordeum vulgare]